MPEDSKESKAKKLAAARKKLREFQAKDKKDTDGSQTEQATPKPNEITSIAVKEEYTPVPSPQLPINNVSALEEEPAKVEENETPSTPMSQNHTHSNSSIETIQILIAEKAALSSELNKFRNICREKELENEELQTQFNMTSKRLDELQKEFLLQQKTIEELNSNSLTLQVQMERMRSQNDDQTEHLEETKKLLAIEKDRNQALQNELKATSNELELTKIRINQLSDEASISKDNRVETLTQTQFMYEQQIRDLQAMVQQLTRDKEQANQQYQTYVQHLNSEVTTLNDKNNELTEECSKLQDRERQFIEHISSLEREIQKSISKQSQFKENQETETSEDHTKEIEELKAKLADYESGRYEFQLKIKSQEDRLDVLNANLSAKDSKISELEEQIQNILSERPDNEKLLATMESDKIAASRALTQNDALKKQLDELEMKFVQLTNDKADLVNKLDAEEYANREIRSGFSSLEEQLQNLDKKLHFKDEEMIRLTHENNDLTRQNLVLQQQLDRLQHYEARYYLEKFENGQDQSKHNSSDDHDHSVHNHENCHDHDHEHSHSHKEGHSHEHGLGQDHEDDHDHNHDYGHDHSDGHNTERQSECSSGHAGHDHSHSPTTSDEHDHPKGPLHSSAPASPDHNHQPHSHHVHSHYRPDEPPTIPTMEALQKLQSRFTKLMAQVADLTEEKQRLEHLVLQLQGETETIGEYIALYQTQRRILKQREYEKAAQLQLLLAEREEMREKITTLNKLVSNLGLELPNNLRLNENLNSVMENICIEPSVPHPAGNGESQEMHQGVLDEAVMNKRLNSNESKEILAKIQNIITEIKENTKDVPPVHAADHLTCCSGKFETV